MQSKTTLCYKRGYIIFSVLSYAVRLTPVVFFIVKGLADGTIKTEQKLSLGFCLIAAIIMTLVAATMRMRLTTPFFLALYGINACLNDLSLVIAILGACAALDEIAFSPARKHYKAKYGINREIDKRYDVE